MSCHVMSCHVMSCRYYCIDSHRNILETFLSIKNFIKHFAGIFTRTRCAPQGDNKCNDEKNIVITREWNDRSNLFYVDCFAPRCVPHSVCFSNGNARTRCAPHGDDDNKNFQFDKFQRLFSVIYKKNSLTKEISK